MLLASMIPMAMCGSGWRISLDCHEQDENQDVGRNVDETKTEQIAMPHLQWKSMILPKQKEVKVLY